MQQKSCINKKKNEINVHSSKRVYIIYPQINTIKITTQYANCVSKDHGLYQCQSHQPPFHSASQNPQHYFTSHFSQLQHCYLYKTAYNLTFQQSYIFWFLINNLEGVLKLIELPAVCTHMDTQTTYCSTGGFTMNSDVLNVLETMYSTIIVWRFYYILHNCTLQGLFPNINTNWKIVIRRL